MGIHERKLREKENRVRQIINAAEDIFFSKGVDTATIDEIAERAEISKGTVYIYFKSKEELIAAVFARALDILREFIRENMAGSKNGLDKIRGMGKAYIAFSRKYPDYFALMFITPHTRNCANQAANALSMVAEVITEGQKDGSIRPGLPPLQTAVVLWGQLHGVLAIAANEKVCAMEHFSFSIEELVEECIDVVTNGLTA
jgi:TetR/AcrR family transcriptional regulator